MLGRHHVDPHPDMSAARLPHDGNPLITSLLNPACYPHTADRMQLLETHISWVLLAGDYAYKIKKPVNLGFLDFSTLELRRKCCAEELRLNRRFAPQLYLDCVTITGTIHAPGINGDGPVIDHAVRMRRFPQSALASRLLAAGQLLPQHIDTFASLLADTHRNADRAPAGSLPGTPESVLEAAMQNLDVIAAQPDKPASAAVITKLRQWTSKEHGLLHDLMVQRRRQGAVRECHGDLHLGNIVMLDGALLPFDCIEFGPALRWNDVLSEVAFLVMDLHVQDASRLAWLFLNSYLEQTGDYGGLRLLSFYLAYRALVRAKIAVLRAAQLRNQDAGYKQLLQSAKSHIAFAEKLMHPPPPALLIMHGLSGSGKSRVSRTLLMEIGAIRIRSDVERKRLHGMPARERHGAAAGLYGERATAETYRHLAEQARDIIAAGFTLIVDAACLQRSQRDQLRDVAAKAGVPCMIIPVTAPVAVLQSRLLHRAALDSDASDAGIAVLEQQMNRAEPPSEDEKPVCIESPADEPDSGEYCRKIIDQLHAARLSQAPG